MTVQRLSRMSFDLFQNFHLPQAVTWVSACRPRASTVLLVTPAFLKSEFIKSSELPAALRAAEAEGLVILWIPVKPSSYERREGREIAEFQAAQPPSAPLSGLRGAKRNQALVSIASHLADVLGVNRTNAL